MEKIRWGVLSTARIGQQKVIPAMQNGQYCEVKAIASRDKGQAEAVAKALNIERAYGSYEEILNDVGIDAVYIPLPNHLHVPWTIKALEAGKHVLCEKPIGLSSDEAKQLNAISMKYPHLKVMEAFMYRFHPQWLLAKRLVEEGKIGTVKTIQAFFSYYNTDPGNIRNQKDIGGGGLMDIGCYCVSQSRFILGKEPVRVQGFLEYDSTLGIDSLASAILDFGTSTATFTCSTQLARHQNFKILATKGVIEIEIPVNVPPDKPSRIWLEADEKREEILFEPYNQYTLQGDLFSKAILDDTDVPASLEDAINNMKVIEAIKKSHEEGKWIELSD